MTPPASTATLTVTATGRGGERVTSSPAGINVSVGSTGSASFNVGTAITLSPTKGRDVIWFGGLFERWQQGQDLHVRAERERLGDRQRAVSDPEALLKAAGRVLRSGP